MRIVHLMGYFVPELGYQEYYLAKAHAKMGHDVYVIASDLLYPFPNIEDMLKEAGAGNTSRKRKPGFSVVDGIKVYRLKSFFEYSDFILCSGLKETLEKINPDVVFAHESRQGLTAGGALYKKKLGYRLIVDQHDFNHKIPNHPWHMKMLRFLDYSLFRRFVVDYSLRKADKVVAVTDETKKFLEDAHGMKGKDVAMIPLGVDTDFFKFDSRVRSSIRKKYQIKSDDIIFVFSGTIVRRKGIELLLNAFLETQIENSWLFIIGTGEKSYMDYLRGIAKSGKIERRCIFTGFMTKEGVRDYFSAADIGVWPGNNSISIMEAMACSLPIIMVDLQLGSLVRFKNGFKFKEADIEALKSIMKDMAKDKKMLKVMGAKSSKAIRENYSYDSIAKKFLELA